MSQSSISSQREKSKKLSFKEKKLGRLLYCKDLSPVDSRFLNYLNEERMNLNFFYGIGAVFAVAVSVNYALFRMARARTQLIVFASVGVFGHLMVRRMINRRFEQRIEPYFQKYSVK